MKLPGFLDEPECFREIQQDDRDRVYENLEEERWEPVGGGSEDD